MMVRYLLPISYAVLFHLLIAAAMLWGWQLTDKDPEQFKMPEHIKATLMVIEKPKQAPTPDPGIAERRRQQEREAAERKAREQQLAEQKRQQQLAEQKAAEQAAAKQQAAELAEQQRQEALAVEQAEQQRKAQEELARQQAESNLLETLELEESVQREMERQLAQDEQTANNYFFQIQRQIERNWSRPTSARNGMRVGLELHLLPTGELKDVFIIQSSGDAAMDRSAERAVQKVRRFDVPTETRIFEKYFRTFSIAFEPEDLRQ